MSRRALESITQGERDHCALWAALARVLYNMRHACSMTSLGHVNVRKTCTTNTGHHHRAAALLSIQRRHTCRARSVSTTAAPRAASQRVDEYVTIERHRVRRWIGEARRRKRDVLSCFGAHIRPSGMPGGWRPSVADGQGGLRSLWLILLRSSRGPCSSAERNVT